MMARILERQIVTYLAGKSDAELLVLVETLVLPRLNLDQMVLLRDLLDGKIAETSGPLTIVASETVVISRQDPNFSFPRFGDRD